MKTNQETMKVIAEEVNCEDMCPMIDEIAKQVAKGFELATERVFVNDEDEIIFDIMMRLFASGNLMEAVDVLTLTFSIIDSVDPHKSQKQRGRLSSFSLYWNLIYTLAKCIITSKKIKRR